MVRSFHRKHGLVSYFFACSLPEDWFTNEDILALDSMRQLQTLGPCLACPETLGHP